MSARPSSRRKSIGDSVQRAKCPFVAQVSRRARSIDAATSAAGRRADTRGEEAAGGIAATPVGRARRIWVRGPDSTAEVGGPRCTARLTCQARPSARISLSCPVPVPHLLRSAMRASQGVPPLAADCRFPGRFHSRRQVHPPGPRAPRSTSCQSRRRPTCIGTARHPAASTESRVRSTFPTARCVHGARWSANRSVGGGRW